jgi:hypothetical protein
MAQPSAMFDALVDPGDPPACYVIAEQAGWRMLLRLTGDEVDDDTIAPAPQWWRLRLPEPV